MKDWHRPHRHLDDKTVDFLREKKIKLLYLVVLQFCFAVYEFRSNFAFYFHEKPPEVVVVCVFLTVVLFFFEDLAESHGVFPCPLTRQFCVLVPISFKYSGDFWDQWIIGIWITQ